VPDVRNITQNAASSALSAAGLTTGTVTTTSSTTVAAGLVISQNPAGGAQVAPGTAVALVVSSGPPAASAVVDRVAFSDGLGTRTMTGFTTAGPGELLVAFVSSDGPSNQTQSATVSGAGLSWSLVKRTTTQHGTAEIWRATATNALSNASITSTLARTNYRQSLTVVAFSGASGVGASASANATTGASQVSLTTTRANSLVYAVGNDWDKAVPRTAGAGQAIVHQWQDTVTGDTYWVQAFSAAIAASGSVVQSSDTSPTTDRWNFTAVEILAK